MAVRVKSVCHYLGYLPAGGIVTGAEVCPVLRITEFGLSVVRVGASTGITRHDIHRREALHVWVESATGGHIGKGLTGDGALELRGISYYFGDLAPRGVGRRTEVWQVTWGNARLTAPPASIAAHHARCNETVDLVVEASGAARIWHVLEALRPSALNDT